MSNTKIVASDYDGTYSEHPEIRELVDFIVTGRSWRDPRPLNSRGKPVFFNAESNTEPTLDSVISHKAGVINRAKVDVFYENQPAQASVLQIMCPKTRIVLVKPL